MMATRRVVRAARAIVACSHGPERTQRFEVLSARGTVAEILRCHACGALRYRGVWIPTLGAVVLGRAFDAAPYELLALVLRETPSAPTTSPAKPSRAPRSPSPGDVPLVDLLAYAEAAGDDRTVPGAFVHASHLRALLAAYVAVRAAAAWTLEPDADVPDDEACS